MILILVILTGIQLLASKPSAKCVALSDNEMAFVNSLRENLLFQHVFNLTRQWSTDTPHILDLVITSDNFVLEIEHLSPLGMSDHCVLKFGCYLYAEHCQIQQKFRLDKGDYDNLCDFLNLD